MGKRIALIAALVGLGLPLIMWPAVAFAAPVDRRSEHVAIRGLDRYLRQQLSNIPVGRRSADAFVASTSTNCPNVLAAWALLPPSLASTSAALAIGEEAGADVGVVAYASNRVPFAQMNTTLSSLRWSSKRTTATVKRFLAAERALLWLAPSDICSDARALAANPRATPPGTLQWLATLGHVTGTDNAATDAFVKILLRFRTPADAPVIRDISRIANRFASSQETLIHDEGLKLIAALGVAT